MFLLTDPLIVLRVMPWTGPNRTSQMVRFGKSRLLIAIGGIVVFGIVHHAAIGQSQVDMRVGLQKSAPPMSSGSIRYHNHSHLLPSESRYRMRASGMLRSEQTYLRYKEGSLRSDGVATHLQRPTIRYNRYGGQTSAPPQRPTLRYSAGVPAYSATPQSYQSGLGVGAQRLNSKIAPKSAYSRGTIRYN